MRLCSNRCRANQRGRNSVLVQTRLQTYWRGQALQVRVRLLRNLGTPETLAQPFCVTDVRRSARVGRRSCQTLSDRSTAAERQLSANSSVGKGQATLAT